MVLTVKKIIKKPKFLSYFFIIPCPILTHKNIKLEITNYEIQNDNMKNAITRQIKYF